jgi:Glycosyl hydrolase family 57
MKSVSFRGGFVLLLCAMAPGVGFAANTSVHTTWLWHLHQPIYWPDRRDYGVDHYENAWDTIQQQNAGRPDPNPEVLTTIFDDADRVNAYQQEPGSTVNSLLGYPNAGAQVNYSGALMENVQSLAAANQLGYAPGWNNGNATARTWQTSSGKPRMDLVNFTYHHAIAPLLDDQTLAMELRIHQRQMQVFWGTNVPLSRGYFPAETCFSEHIIPILNQAGIAWTLVANNHLARSCADFPLVLGSGGENCDIPNPADQVNPAQGAGNYQRISIARGCAPTQVMPFGFQMHYARYVDPNTGAASEIMLAPSDQVFGWDDSYSTWDLGQIAPLAARNNPSQPALVLCAHDGDNAWSGGYSYYNQWVQQMASTAVSDGYEPTTIEQFIADFPPGTNDVVHVEDGGWVFADSDFGSPSFINWNWPPSYTDTNGNNVVDPSIGVTSKGDNWRVILATENRVETAQQISGIAPDVDQVCDPGSFSGTPNAVELGWHYCCGSLDSGFVYYGCTGDECLRAIVAQSNAVRNVDPVIAANPSADTTPPTVFLPQRHPWNPGGENFGVQYGYKTYTPPDTSFWIWTYAYDVSGITNASLLYRVNGTNPPTSDQFKTYAGGPLAGAWQTTNMTRRIAPNSSGYTPEYSADYYYTKVAGISNAFVDYYVSATDAYGNTAKSPIQHVWVGATTTGGASGSGGPVSVTPAPPVRARPGQLHEY